ncbi:MAG: carboxymuconolactone decarboxylase family protein [Deltaproteobacteria bacterium]|jgi:alkylhydroperoxidase family enzyme|nr:carboxymuconolactone decarboxylase family protein [Deltaproteobacteria bacterium]MBW2496888.1 carboxymuconolactone decarboxylase family protein [Deltaproteobacteria bacterium]
MARIPYLDPEEAPDSVKRLLAPDRANAIALLFGHAETNWPRLADLLLSILGEQALDGRLRELAILRVARLRAARFEWDQHVGISAATGVTREELAAIERGEVDADCFGEVERLVLQAATGLVEQGTLEEELVTRLEEQLSAREAVELLIAIGVYEALAKLMNAVDLDPEPAIDPAFAAQVVAGAIRAEES